MLHIGGKVMNAFFRKTVAAMAFAVAATGVSASTVTLQAQDPDDIFAGNGSAAVKLEVPFDDQSVWARAGGFGITDGINNFVGWCVNMAATLSLPTEYTATNTPFHSGLGFTETVAENLQSLFNTAYSTLDLSSNWQSAGFQLAMWEIIHEDPNNPLNITSGALRFTGGSTLARDFAAELLAGLDGDWTGQYNLSFFVSANDAQGNPLSQNLVTAAPIPLPAAAWMLLAGVLALVAVGRRRRTAA